MRFSEPGSSASESSTSIKECVILHSFSQKAWKCLLNPPIRQQNPHHSLLTFGTLPFSWSIIQALSNILVKIQRLNHRGQTPTCILSSIYRWGKWLQSLRSHFWFPKLCQKCRYTQENQNVSKI
jgi:hypothetical protein